MVRDTLLSVLILSFLISCSNNSQEGKAEYLAIYNIHQSGDHQKSLAMMKDYVKKYPLNYRGWTFYGIVLMEEDQDSIAEDAFNKALQINPKIKEALTGLGVINRGKGNYLEAERLYKKAIKIDPDFSDAYSSLVIIELIRKDFDQAVKFGQTAWSLDNKNGITAANLSLAYHFKGDLESRDEFFNHARQLEYGGSEILKLVFEGKMSLEQLLEIKPEQ